MLNRQIVNTIVTRAASTVINFMIALLIARHAGPAIKGEITLLVTTISFFIFLGNILGGQALVYLIPRNKVELLVLPAYVWSAVISLVGFLFLKFTPLVDVIHIPSIAALSFLSSIISIHQTILFAKRQITNANVVQLIPLSIQLAGVLGCYYFFNIHDAYAYIYASVVAYATGAVVSFFFIKHHVNFTGFTEHFTWKDFSQSLRYGLLFQLVEILQLLNLRYYFFQLGLQQGSQYLGIYSIGISILEAVWIIPRGIATVHYVNTANSSEVKQEAEHTVQLMKISFALCAIALLAIYLVPQQVYTFVFGQGFSTVKHSIRYLFPGVLVYSIWIVLSSFYFGIGKYKQLIISNTVGVATIVLFSSLLIPSYVMSGAGLAATLSFAVAALVLLVLFMIDNRIALKKFSYHRSDIDAVVAKFKNFTNGN